MTFRSGLRNCMMFLFHKIKKACKDASLFGIESEPYTGGSSGGGVAGSGSSSILNS